VKSLTFRYNFSHDANLGHNLKSRADTNLIAYNRFSSLNPGETGGTTAAGKPSYEIDLPNAGTAYIIGNVIHQPSSNGNPNMIAYGEEGVTNPAQDLYVVNNTFLNDDSVRGTFVMIGDQVGTPALLQNNIFSGTGNATNQTSAIDRNNYRSLSPSFINRGEFDLRPALGAAMIDAGAAVGASSGGLSLSPTLQYRFPVGTESRPVNGIIDIGAYEAGGTLQTLVAGTVSAVTAAVTTVATSAATGSEPSWAQCASENGSCSFSGTRQVRYGANGVYAYRSATDGIACDNATFGDPLYGVVKACSNAQ
jgi:hypothetical protein